LIVEVEQEIEEEIKEEIENDWQSQIEKEKLIIELRRSERRQV
jgi:hypothetical protein